MRPHFCSKEIFGQYIGGANVQLSGIIIISEKTALRMDFQNRPGAKTGGGGAATQGMADRFLRKF